MSKDTKRNLATKGKKSRKFQASDRRWARAMGETPLCGAGAQGRLKAEAPSASLKLSINQFKGS